MGLFDAFKGKKEPAEKEPGKEAPGAQEKKKEALESEPGGKYNEACSLCGRGNTEKKWMGQYWHKRCLRGVRRGAKGMI